MAAPKRQSISERGFALVLVMGVLTLMAILAVSFSSNMRIEEKAALNYTFGVRALFFTQTGLSHALYHLKYDNTPGYDAYSTDDWRREFDGTNAGLAVEVELVDESDDGLDNDDNGTVDDEANSDEAIWRYVHEDPSDSNTPIIGRYAVHVIDESGKVNVNQAGDGSQNQGITTWEIDMTQLDFLSAVDAASIIQYVTGGDNFPGDGGDDDANNTFAEDNGIDEDADGDGFPDGDGPVYTDNNEGLNDPGECFFPGSNDQQLSMIELVTKIYEQYGFDNNKSDVEKLLSATTISSFNTNLYYNDGEGGDGAVGGGDDTTPDWRNKIHLNAISDAIQLYNLLIDELSFPEYGTNAAIADGERDIGVARNFPLKLIANIIDYADRDFIPTFLTATGTREMGIEGLQVNEVMTRPYPQVPGATGNRYSGLVLTNDMYVAQAAAPYYTQIPHTGGWPLSSYGDSPNTVHARFASALSRTGTWAWPFDPGGTYYVQIKLGSTGGGAEWLVEPGEPGQVPAGGPGYIGHDGSGYVNNNGLIDVGNVTIGVDGVLNLELTDLLADAGRSTRFDHVFVQNVGEFVEIVNISDQDITVDISGADAWQLRLVDPSTGIPTTYDFDTDAINNPGSIILQGCRYDNTDTTKEGNTQDRLYDYLVICDSEYALDYGYRPAWGRGDGWDRDDNTGAGLHDEPGHIIVIPTLDITDSGDDIFLLDGDGHILAVATVNNSTGAAGYGCDGYNDPSNPADSQIQSNHSMRKRSPPTSQRQYDSLIPGWVESWRYSLELRSSNDSADKYNAAKIDVRDFSVEVAPGDDCEIYGLQFDGSPGGDNGRQYTDGVAGLSQTEIDSFTNEFFNALSIANKRTHVKDRPFGTVGELDDLVESHKSTTVSSDIIQMMVDAFTVEGIRVEAEAADSLPVGAPGTADDGTDVFTNAAGHPWAWTAGSSGVRFEDGATYDVFVYGTKGDRMNVTATSGSNSVGATVVDLLRTDLGGGLYADGAPFECGYVGNIEIDGSTLEIDISAAGGTASLNALMLVPTGSTVAARGKINVNTATRDTLLCLPQITGDGSGPGIFNTVDVDEIISRRNTKPFESIGELLDADVDDMYIYRDDPTRQYEHDAYNFRALSNLLTVHSNAFKIIVRGQSVWDTDGDGNEANSSSEDQTTGEKKIEVVVERHYDEGTGAPTMIIKSFREVLND